MKGLQELSAISVYLAIMASHALLDKLNCALNKQNSLAEKVEGLKSIKHSCEDAFATELKAKREMNREIYVGEFAELQFPKANDCALVTIILSGNYKASCHEYTREMQASWDERERIAEYYSFANCYDLTRTTKSLLSSGFELT